MQASLILGMALINCGSLLAMAVGQINLDVEVEVLIANKLAHASFVGACLSVLLVPVPFPILDTQTLQFLKAQGAKCPNPNKPG